MIKTPQAALEFVERHGIVLERAAGVVLDKGSRGAR